MTDWLTKLTKLIFKLKEVVSDKMIFHISIFYFSPLIATKSHLIFFTSLSISTHLCLSALPFYMRHIHFFFSKGNWCYIFTYSASNDLHVFCNSSRFAITSLISSNNMRFWFSIHSWFLVFIFSANCSRYFCPAVLTERSNLLVIWTDSGVSLLEIYDLW